MTHDSFYLLSGLMISTLYSLLVFRNEKEPPRINITFYPIFHNGSIKIPIANNAIHIHHWIFFVGVLVVLLGCYIGPYTICAMGFCVGMIFQGLLYNDCFDIIVPNPYH